MLKIIIFLLMFGSISFLAYAYLPYFMQRYAQIQKARVKKATPKLDQMFIFAERHRLVRMYSVTPLSLGLLGFILCRNPIGILVGAAVGSVLPPIIIKNMFVKRRNKFQNQLVDGLMVLSSCLKAGLSMNQAFEVLAEEAAPPISDEFALVVKENEMGVALEDCLAHLKLRMPTDDLDLIIAAINIARETGGNLTDIFSQLVLTMREKRKLEDRVRALTIQGRLQGYIMMVLPIAFAIFTYIVSPNNFETMLKDKLGQMLLIWAIISEGIGIILIKKLSRVEV